MTRSLIFAAVFLGVAAPVRPQEVMPFTRNWSALGTKLSITAWDRDAGRAERGIAQARAAVLRIDSVLFLQKGDAQLSKALLHARAIDAAVDALQAEGVRQGSAELAGNARYFGKPPEGDVWGVAIRAPVDEDQVLALVTMEAGAVAGYSGSSAGKPQEPNRQVMAIGATALEAAGRAATLYALGQAGGCARAERLGWSAMWVQSGQGNAGVATIVVTSALRGTIQVQSTDGAKRPTVETCRPAG